ncbi:NAD(P)H-binding protein [bacterium SCSIO 12643]|nr:NAD(P)H-binding protein [bacterium SCSIO 12643]
MKFTASVLGGTGLVGHFLTQELIADENCEKIIFITRKNTSLQHPKIETRIINFDHEPDYVKYIKGDVLFSCLGTTRAQAKSIRKHYLVDYHYQFRAAQAAAKNGVENYVLVSSPWSNIQSKNYYRKMKAELERDVQNLGFKKIALIKPNGLAGKRKKPRFGETYGIRLFNILAKCFPTLKKHQPIDAKKVAQIMLLMYYHNLTRDSILRTIERDELNKLLPA